MIDLSTPMPLADAIAHISAKTPIGSILRSAEWAQMPLALRERAQFSAGVESVRMLAAIQAKLESHISGLREQVTNGEAWVDRSSFIGDMRQMAKDLGVTTAAPHEAGTIKDIRSSGRLGMILDIQTGQSRGYAGWKMDQDEDVLDAYPAQELVRLEGRRVPRNWRARWVEAGGELFEGRMIALKNDPIWMRLSRFGTPWPPFDFNSGMGLRDVSRDEAEALGVIKPGQAVQPIVEDYNAHLQASVQGIPPAFQRALQRFFGDQIEISGDQVRWRGSRPMPIANSGVWKSALHPRDRRGMFRGADHGGGSGGAGSPGGHPLSSAGASRRLTRGEQAQSIDAALKVAAAGGKQSFSLGTVRATLAARVAAITSGTQNWTGKELRIDSDFVRHAKKFHVNLTDDDFHAIPELLAGAQTIKASVTDRGLPAMEFHLNKDGRDHLLIAAVLNKQGQIQLTTLKKSKKKP